MKSSNWNYPTPIRFGPGRVSELAEACTELGLQRPLLVTDGDLAALPVFEEIRAGLKGLDHSVFSEVVANPDEGVITRGVEAYQSAGCDGVVAVGGGSPLDAGKTIALMVGQERPLFDFVDEGDNYKRVIAERVAPIVAVPTTSGTGSEVGRAAVITDSHKLKKLIFHPLMLPSRVIADPELTLGMPPRLTAAVGMDALAHNLEAFCSPVFHPMAQGIAVEGIRLIAGSLVKAYRNGKDLEARCDMLAASTMGAAAFQKGLGAIHSLSHPVGGRYGLHHGTLNAVFMPYVLKFNREALGPKWGQLEQLLEEDPLEWVLELRRVLQIPHTLAEMGLPEEVVELAAEATLDPSASTNPRPVDEAAHRKLLEDAFSGIL